ncbi:hypothetical protein TNIN_378491 [Trichonephila inaurata madagascariensis]|uniref:Uncharacterized protein n=1 Tax=Trichonephila inaurata madagascariensis TaxID=2747483 RepID=A0A8X7CMF2_9ARAC|nr:hypothetical protein TNIN_378491 [Trichonephila inaurata madagascariensis]
MSTFNIPKLQFFAHFFKKTTQLSNSGKQLNSAGGGKQLNSPSNRKPKAYQEGNNSTQHQEGNNSTQQQEESNSTLRHLHRLYAAFAAFTAGFSYLLACLC